MQGHMKTSHPSVCPFCGINCGSNTDVPDHINLNHVFDCESCDFTGTGEEFMEDHILDKHAMPDSNSGYSCDECSFRTTDKSEFGHHFKTLHGSRSKVL